MARKSLPTRGIVPLNPQDGSLPKWATDKILSAVNIEGDEATAFLKEIELAVIMTLRRQDLHGQQVKSSTVQKALHATAKAAAKMVEALKLMPLEGRQFYRRAGLPYPEALNRAEEIQAATEQAVDQTKKLFSGGGSEKDNNPVILVADINAALVKAGMKPSYSRPKPNSTGNGESSLWQITRVCFRLCGVECKDDFYPYIKASRSANISWV